VEGDTNSQHDIFVHDRQTGTTELVSVNSSGNQANNTSERTSVSADGRHVAFLSLASNLVENDTNGQRDVFVHERETATQPDDCIAPTTTASATTTSGAPYESGTWTKDDVKVTFSAQDNLGGSGLKDIRYSASGAQSMPLTVYDPQNPPVINTDGHTTMSYFATDNAGNMEPPKRFSVMLDKSAPDTQIVSGPLDFVSSTSASFFLSKDASEDGWMVSFQCRLDGGAFATCPQSKSYSSLSQGKHTFEARTVDKAGNVDASPASRTWFVDTTVPRGTISINSGRASTSSRSVTLGLSASDPSPASGVASMRFRNENTTTWAEWVSFSTNVPWTLSSGAGSKTVYAQFKDRAGNVSATKYDRIKYSP
jgi:hypothetical protein